MAKIPEKKELHDSRRNKKQNLSDINLIIVVAYQFN